MEIQNAVRLVEKTFGKKVVSQKRSYEVEVNNKVLSFSTCDNEPDSSICCINVRDTNDVSEIYIDYTAGSYFRNLKQAIDYISK